MALGLFLGGLLKSVATSLLLDVGSEVIKTLKDRDDNDFCETDVEIFEGKKAEQCIESGVTDTSGILDMATDGLLEVGEAVLNELKERDDNSFDTEDVSRFLAHKVTEKVGDFIHGESD